MTRILNKKQNNNNEKKTRFHQISLLFKLEGCFTGNKNESHVRKCETLSLSVEPRLFVLFCTITLSSTSKEMSNAKEINFFYVKILY